MHVNGPRGSPAIPRPRVLFVGSTAYELPLTPGLARKWDAVSERLDVRIIARGRDGGDSRFRLLGSARGVPHGPTYLARLAAVVADEGRRFRPHLVIAASPYEAAVSLPAVRLLRSRPKLIVELHGDPRTAARVYGSPLRRIYAVPGDRLALVGLRGADATRAISNYTAAIAKDATGREPAAIFPTYFDLESFLRDPPRPFPEQPQAAWVGMLQRLKDPGLLVSAWRRVAVRMPEARLVIVGQGPLRPQVDALATEFPRTVKVVPKLSPPEIARLLDDSTLLALSSISEGLGRVVLEAFARGRPVVSTAVGGVLDTVVPERNGLLVPVGDVDGLASALERVLGDRHVAERLGHAAAEDAGRFRWTPDRYADALRDLVDSVVSGV